MVLLFKQLSGLNYSAIKGIIACRVDMKAILCCRTCSIMCIESESNEVIVVYCSKCGKELSDTAKFCGGCGSPIKTRITAAVENVKPDTEKVQPDIKRKSMIITIAGTVLSFVVLYFIIFGVVKIAEHFFPSKLDAMDIPAPEENSNITLITNDDLVDITNIEFSYYYDRYVLFDFENKSDKDIAYIEFETYFYDTMGRFVEKETLEYTGPLYKGEQDSAKYCPWSFDSNTGVIYPKIIKITFFDDTTATIRNSLYAYSDDFYGGELKDEEEKVSGS